ncbi:MAG: CocE/NonD family hydrolase [Nitrososphaerales archaeon]
MFSQNWKTSERKHSVLTENGVKIPTRDGTVLNANIFRPADEQGKKFPAILGIHPYQSDQSPPIKSKALSSSAGMWAPGIERPNASLESGDPTFYVRRGYAHIICNLRGTGDSEGIYEYNSKREVEDVHDVIEWIAKQSWCDGNVGMFGVSYFATIQKFVAGTNPPHLKCLFAPWGASDYYRDVHYHGGILSLFVTNYSRQFFKVRMKSAALAQLGEEGFTKAVATALKDEQIAGTPRLVDMLKNSDNSENALTIDMILHRLDDEFWEERRVKYENIKIPCYTGADWGMYAIHLASAFRDWENIKSPKKMMVGPPTDVDRPLYQLQYESLRWFDYWLKGVNTGIMDEPPVKLYVMGEGRWKKASQWPLPETMWTPFYLHEDKLLSEREFWPNEMFDTYEDSPWGRGFLTYYTPPLVEKTEVIGPLVLNVYASTTADEVLWFASFRDVDPDGRETILTRGWLRGSHREIDQKRSKPWRPFHPHNRSVPLKPNEIYEFNIEILPTANLFKENHRIGLKISSVDDQPQNTHESLASLHLRSQSASRITVYHDAERPSNILVPVTDGNVIGTFLSGGGLVRGAQG